MKASLSPGMERVRHCIPGGGPGDGAQGAFKISGPLGMQLRIIASDARDWAEAGLLLPAWEHVSVSLERRCPTWAEMEWVRDEFFLPDETVVQFSVPRAIHISYHPYTLHMWRPIGVDIPLPPSITVAPPLGEAQIKGEQIRQHNVNVAAQAREVMSERDALRAEVAALKAALNDMVNDANRPHAALLRDVANLRAERDALRAACDAISSAYASNGNTQRQKAAFALVRAALAEPKP